MSTDKSIAAATSESSVGSSNEVNLLVSIKPAENKGDLADLLDENSFKLKIDSVPDLPLQVGGSMENTDFNNNNRSQIWFVFHQSSSCFLGTAQ
jgi:hypothetical protein